ncbi:Panacea domain-containing protein [uncultured Hoeflea sp.]|uniref:Panacea domain-containing protein n=1 Tax=uncultured Hoeflea sp. TaxID=538666 RepID=UPI0030DB06E6|tara:strand:- start:479 stop:925 length:447 start_codon:yes stop_codon:yes gene_type:complete
MTVQVLAAAKRLAERSGWTLTNLELQKILYLAHMFHLGRTGGEPLVQGNFEAWDYGPVHPDLYHKAKIFGSDPVKNVFHGLSDLPHCSERQIIDEAYSSLGNAGPGRLVNATHRRGGAWDANYVPGLRHCIIPNADILREYQGLDNAA